MPAVTRVLAQGPRGVQRSAGRAKAPLSLALLGLPLLRACNSSCWEAFCFLLVLLGEGRGWGCGTHEVPVQGSPVQALVPAGSSSAG